MSDDSNYLSPNRPHAVRLGVSEAQAQALCEVALARIGYSEVDAHIIIDQLIGQLPLRIPVRRIATRPRDRARGEAQVRPRSRGWLVQLRCAEDGLQLNVRELGKVGLTGRLYWLNSATLRGIEGADDPTVGIEGARRNSSDRSVEV